MEYILLMLCLLGSAFFSGTEIAYTSLNKLKMRQESEHPSRTQKLVHYIYNHYDRALSTLLIGNNLVNIAATSLATVLAIRLSTTMAGKITDEQAVRWERRYQDAYKKGGLRCLSTTRQYCLMKAFQL